MDINSKYVYRDTYIEWILLGTCLDHLVPARILKRLSHEIFGPVFWAVWVYLGLNVNRLWFLNVNDAPLILDTYFKL